MPEHRFNKHYRLFLSFRIKIWQPVFQDGRQNKKLAYFNQLLIDFEDFDDFDIKLYDFGDTESKSEILDLFKGQGYLVKVKVILKLEPKRP